MQIGSQYKYDKYDLSYFILLFNFLHFVINSFVWLFAKHRDGYIIRQRTEQILTPNLLQIISSSLNDNDLISHERIRLQQDDASDICQSLDQKIMSFRLYERVCRYFLMLELIQSCPNVNDPVIPHERICESKCRFQICVNLGFVRTFQAMVSRKMALIWRLTFTWANA